MCIRDRVETDQKETPISENCITETDDAYNFYHSQVRIAMERAFVILVHRWVILWCLLGMLILKVPSVVLCLMMPHVNVDKIVVF